MALSKQHIRSRFSYSFIIATVAAFLIPNIFSATSSLDLATLKGPVIQEYPTPSEAQRNQFLMHGDPTPPSRITLEENDYLNDETTKMDGRIAFQCVVNSTSIWSIYKLEDPRHLVIGCPAHHAWVYVDAPSLSMGQEARIGRVVTTNWELERYDSLEGNARFEATMMLTQLNPNEIETIVKTEDLQSWSIFSECPESNLEWKVAVEQQWGWPFRSAFSVLWLKSTGRMRMHSGYAPLPDYGQKDDYPTHALFLGKRNAMGLLTDPRHIAIGFLPSGFIGNMAVYTITIWLALTGIVLIKRKIRVKRGRCPLCSYILNADLLKGCPECGWLKNQQRN